MSGFLAVLEFSFSVTGPIFVVLALGVWLRHAGMLTDAFIEAGSKLVFTVALPAMLFISIARADLGAAANLSLVAFGAVATLVVFALLEWFAHRRVYPARDRGVVVQGAFRSNLGITGLAYVMNAYGEPGLVASSLYLALITILYNVLAVVTLNRSLGKHRGLRGLARGIATNPLIIGIGLALPVSWSGITLPGVVLQSGQYVSNLTLPLALLCTGAALDFRSLQLERNNTLIAAASKLVAVPLLVTVAGAALGFRGMELGILLLMASAPTAAASYVMVRAMGGNATLAANIIALTTLGSIVTTSFGVAVLRGLGLM